MLITGSVHTLIENPNWWEADKLAVRKGGQGIETREYCVTNLVKAAKYETQKP